MDHYTVSGEACRKVADWGDWTEMPESTRDVLSRCGLHLLTNDDSQWFVVAPLAMSDKAAKSAVEAAIEAADIA